MTTHDPYGDLRHQSYQVPIGTKMRARRDLMTGVRKGDTGTYTFGAEYVPGWDAGRYDVTLDRPLARLLVQAHWTFEEMLDAWEPFHPES